MGIGSFMKELHLQNFKCFESFKIENLNRINIFVGDNGSGKTSILDAICLLLPYRPNLDYLLKRYYSKDILNTYTLLDTLFRIFSREGVTKLKAVFESDEIIEISSDNLSDFSLKQFYDNSGVLKNIYVPSEYIYIDENTKAQVIDILKEINPEIIKSMYIIAKQNNKVKYLEDCISMDIQSGFYKMFMILGSLFMAKDGIVLIDGIENNIYHESYSKFWKYIEKLAIKNNIQLFITTHSYEFLLSSIIETTENIDSINVYTLRKSGTNIRYVDFQGKEVKEMLDANYEVR